MRSLRFFRPRNRWSFHHICYIYSKSARSFPFRPLCFQRFLRTTKMSDFCTHIPSFRYAYGRISIEKVQTSRGHRKFFCQHASCFHTVRSGRMFTVFSVRHRASSPFSRVAIVLRHNALIDSGLLTRVQNCSILFRLLSTAPHDAAVDFTFCVAVPFAGRVILPAKIFALRIFCTSSNFLYFVLNSIVHKKLCDCPSH